MSTKMIKLTDEQGRVHRLFGIIPGTRYMPWKLADGTGGTLMFEPNGGGAAYRETPEQIDALLSGDEPAQPADPLVGELVEALKLAKAWIEDITDPCGEPYNTICAALSKARAAAMTAATGEE